MNPEQQIRNTTFYNSLTKLADKTIEKYLVLKKSNLPVRPIVRITEFGSQTKYEELERPGYELIVMKNIDIFNLQEFKECIDIITGDEILSSNFGRMINGKYVNDDITWPDEKVFGRAIWKYKIGFEVHHLMNDWHKGVTLPKNIMLNTGRKSIDGLTFRRFITQLIEMKRIEGN